MNNHDGTFREEALLRGVALGQGGSVMGGMGVALETTISMAISTC